jgi:putative oxidoreductase
VTTGRANAPGLPTGGFASAVGAVIGWLDRVPYALLAPPPRIPVATVFWNSAMAHLTNWDATLDLFATDYRLPFLPPVAAAYLTIAIELAAPALLVIGLLTRPTVLVLLGMTTVIEVFIYPLAWPTHIQWAAMMLVLLCRGGGTLSLDAAIKPWLLRRAAPGEGD